MLLYIIDGFNVIHKVPEVKKSTSPQKNLISYIAHHKLTGSKNNKVVLVFDGFYAEPLPREKNFEIIFSRDKDADSLIKYRMQKSKRKSETIAVSDDREIRDEARKLGVRLLRVGDFLKKRKKRIPQDRKDISYSLQYEITEELRRIWLKDEQS
ncbi:MAG: hypothetical protein GF375_01155 [Candidatus Omnitrophica bacterium]|nr:hypothetical protein [Candidatus Omnitrophota bacterium]